MKGSLQIIALNHDQPQWAKSVLSSVQLCSFWFILVYFSWVNFSFKFISDYLGSEQYISAELVLLDWNCFQSCLYWTLMKCKYNFQTLNPWRKIFQILKMAEFFKWLTFYWKISVLRKISWFCAPIPITPFQLQPEIIVISDFLQKGL